MPRKKSQHRTFAQPQPPSHGATSHPPTVSPRWLLTAFAVALVGAALCAWATLCLLFWQGSWQLLYHPEATMAHTPASAGIAYDPVGFAATETGAPRLSGWWIPAAPAATLSRFTVLYLHGATGNLGDSLDALVQLHRLGVNVFAFDYRGYGQSQFAHPSEAHLLEDAGWSLDYLTLTRHIDPHTIVLDGSGLGADLAIEVAASHPNLAGVVLEAPVENAASVILDDSRAHQVPARLLVKDRYDIDAAAADLRLPSLWLLPSSTSANAGEPSALGKVSARRQSVRLAAGPNAAQEVSAALSRWFVTLAPNPVH